MEAVDASVVIVTRNRPAFAVEAIRSVLAGAAQPREVIVVDQSAEQPVVLEQLEAEQPLVRLVSSAAAGLSRGRNIGICEARGKIVAFLDDDELADPEWLATFVAQLRNDDAAVLTGRVLAGEPESAGALVSAAILASEPAQYRGRLSHDPLAGGNMAARRATLTEVGGFDTRLGAGSQWPGAEDNDLGLRLLDAGYTIRYEPGAVVVHRAWRPPRSYPRVRWAYGLGKGGFYAKHARGHRCYGVRRAGRDIGKRIRNVPAALLRGPPYAAGELSYAAGVIVGFVRWKLQGN
jgi:GT2 family glycosyltransferase